MNTRVTEGARRERHETFCFSGYRPGFSLLSRGFAARRGRARDYFSGRKKGQT